MMFLAGLFLSGGMKTSPLPHLSSLPLAGALYLLLAGITMAGEALYSLVAGMTMLGRRCG